MAVMIQALYAVYINTEIHNNYTQYWGCPLFTTFWLGSQILPAPLSKIYTHIVKLTHAYNNQVLTLRIKTHHLVWWKSNTKIPHASLGDLNNVNMLCAILTLT